MVVLKGCSDYVADLRTDDDSDGVYTYVWTHDITRVRWVCPALWPHVVQVVFHVSTLMPVIDDNVNNKKRLIGNDFVTITFNDRWARL
jgi:hypothetical protein